MELSFWGVSLDGVQRLTFNRKPWDSGTPILLFLKGLKPSCHQTNPYRKHCPTRTALKPRNRKHGKQASSCKHRFGASSPKRRRQTKTAVAWCACRVGLLNYSWLCCWVEYFNHRRMTSGHHDCQDPTTLSPQDISGADSMLAVDFPASWLQKHGSVGIPHHEHRL